MENYNDLIKIPYTIEGILESLNNIITNNKDREQIKKNLEGNLSHIQIFDSDILYEALEGYSSAEIMRNSLSSYREMFNSNAILEDKFLQTSDGTYSENIKGETFNTIGSYIKFIDASKIVPIKVYEQIVGYLHVHDTSASKKASALVKGTETNFMASTSNIFSSTNIAESNRDAAVKSIVNAITEGILSSFSNKFVNKNSDFKKLIADCIIANGLVNNSFQIQFIPAKYIIPFSINENEDNVGVSILQDSLFPAKMLLSLIVSKLLLYMNKSGNKTISYVRKGTIDVNTSNHVQRVIRMMQENQITFSDLLSTNLSFAKFSRNGNIQLPMAKNGDRLIDFETQEGQDVDLNTPMEEYLEKLAIMGTGVPSVILEYTDAADYAKSITTANIKFAGRVATLQSDLEEATTELYIKLLETSNLESNLKNKAKTHFTFKLCRPKVLTNSNMADYLSQMRSVVDTLSDLLIEQSDDEDAAKIKQKFAKKMTSKLLPFLDIGEYEDIIQQAKLEVIQEKNYDQNLDENSNDTLGSNGEEEEEY
jgi:hypothetical protein